MALEMKLLLESYVLLIRSRVGVANDKLPSNEEIKEKVLRMNAKYLGDCQIEKKALLAMTGWSRRRKSSAGSSSGQGKHPQIHFIESRTQRGKLSSRASLTPQNRSSQGPGQPHKLRMKFDDVFQSSDPTKTKRKLDFSSRIEEKVLEELQKKLSKVLSAHQHKSLMKLNDRSGAKSFRSGVKEIIDNFGSSVDVLNFTELNSFGQSASIRLDDSKPALGSSAYLHQPSSPEEITPEKASLLKKPSQFFKIHNKLQPN